MLGDATGAIARSSSHLPRLLAFAKGSGICEAVSKTPHAQCARQRVKGNKRCNPLLLSKYVAGAQNVASG